MSTISTSTNAFGGILSPTVIIIAILVVAGILAATAVFLFRGKKKEDPSLSNGVSDWQRQGQQAQNAWSQPQPGGGAAGWGQQQQQPAWGTQNAQQPAWGGSEPTQAANPWGAQAGAAEPTQAASPWGAQAGAGSSPNQANPWAAQAQNSPQQQQQANPWAAQAQASSSPNQANPWGAQAGAAEPTQAASPWGAQAQNSPQQQANPWGAQAPAGSSPNQANPWAAQAQNSPQQQQQANPWGAQAQAGSSPNQANPRGAQAQNSPQQQANPWAAQAQNSPQQQPQANPWGAQQAQQQGAAAYNGGSPWNQQAADPWPNQQAASPGNSPAYPSWQQGGMDQGAGAPADPSAALFGNANGDKTMLRSGPTGGVGVVRIEEGKDPGRVYEIRKQSLSMGRSRDSDIFLEDLAVSRLHASLLDMGNGNYAVKDEGSANGTKVNGQALNKYQTYPLQEGDRIQLGQTVLVFARQ